MAIHLYTVSFARWKRSEHGAKLRRKTLDPTSSNHFVWPPSLGHNERYRSNTKSTETLNTRSKGHRASTKWFAFATRFRTRSQSIDACIQLTRESASAVMGMTPGASPTTATTTNAMSQSTSRPGPPPGEKAARHGEAQERRRASERPVRMGTVAMIQNKTAPKSQRTRKLARIMRFLVCLPVPGCCCTADCPL